MPNELRAPGGGGVEDALLSASYSQAKSLCLKVSCAAKVISAVGHSSAEILCPEGRSGNSSNCKVKLTPPIILSVCVLSPFMASLILLSKNKDVPMFPTPRPSALHLLAFFPIEYMFIHNCYLREGGSAAKTSL